MAYSKNIWVVIFFLCILAGPIIAQNYKDSLGKAILFFEGQRSGRLPVSQRVKWRGDSALVDGKIEHVCICLKKNDIFMIEPLHIFQIM